MTPDTTTSTHYLFYHSSDAVTAYSAIAPVIKETLTAAFDGENAPMLRAQTERIGGRDFWTQGPRSAVIRQWRGAGRLLAEERNIPA